MKKLVALLLAITLLLNCSPLMASPKHNPLTKEDIKAIAIDAVKAKGIVLKEVDIIYDEGGKLWLQRSGIAAMRENNPNHGILKQGFLYNYRIVYFDFKDPGAKDIWVFIDKDTGEVLTVYAER
ncbi:MAG: hypothetical protein WC469_02605 [Candidatus Omnitrophota bacterium]